ncbi:MAG: PorP/SprF family type IX secretion system membrane protein [Chitinophagales bacterium]
MRHITNKIALLLLFSLFSMMGLQAQDPHFSQNYASPLFINPAMTGLFQGDVRVAGIYRNQWASLFPDAPFRTITVSAEKAFDGVGQNDRLAAGIMLYNDKAGDLAWQTNYIDLALSYNLALTESAYLSVGLAGGVTQKGFDLSNAQFDDQYNMELGEITGSSIDVISAENLTNANVAGGVMFYKATSHRNNFYIGGALYHLTNADLRVTGNDETDNLFSKITTQVGGSIPIGAKMDIVPSAYFIKQGSAIDAMAGTFLRFIFAEDKRMGLTRAFNIGSWVRVGDTNAQNSLGLSAVSVIGKIDYDQLSLGINYDVTLSQLQTANANRGGVEIALIYTGLTETKRQPLVCPSF